MIKDEWMIPGEIRKKKILEAFSSIFWLAIGAILWLNHICSGISSESPAHWWNFCAMYGLNGSKGLDVMCVHLKSKLNQVPSVFWTSPSIDFMWKQFLKIIWTIKTLDLPLSEKRVKVSLYWSYMWLKTRKTTLGSVNQGSDRVKS